MTVVEGETLLERVAFIRDQARDFGDHSLAFLMHDVRIALLNAETLTNVFRRQLVESYERTARQQRRIAEQVELIRRMRAATDPAHEDPVPPAPWH